MAVDLLTLPNTDDWGMFEWCCCILLGIILLPFFLVLFYIAVGQDKKMINAHVVLVLLVSEAVTDIENDEENKEDKKTHLTNTKNDIKNLSKPNEKSNTHNNHGDKTEEQVTAVNTKNTEKEVTSDKEKQQEDFTVLVTYKDLSKKEKQTLNVGKKRKIEPIKQTSCSLCLTTDPKLTDYFQKELSVSSKLQIGYNGRSSNKLQSLPDEVDTARKLQAFCDVFDVPPALHITINPDDTSKDTKYVIISKADITKWKTLTVACLMTTTILIANSIQLSTLLSEGPANNKFYYVVLVLVILTIVTQSLNTIFLIIVNTIKCGDKQSQVELWKNRIMNVSICVMSFITLMSIVTVFVNIFGLN